MQVQELRKLSLHEKLISIDEINIFSVTLEGLSPTICSALLTS